MSASRVATVMMRTPQPRTSVEIAWHIPEMSIPEVETTLIRMCEREKAVCIVGSDGIVRYYLVLHGTRRDGWDCLEPAVAIALGLVLIGATILGGIGLLFVVRLALAMVRAAL